MKTKLYSFLFVSVIGFVTSCAKDDNALPQENTINGTWNLINVHGGMTSTNINYSKGDVKWIFNQADSTLSVQNKIGNDNSFMLHSATYTFNIEQNGETQVLFVDNNDYRMIILSIDNSLIINDNLADGFTAEFKR